MVINILMTPLLLCSLDVPEGDRAKKNPVRSSALFGKSLGDGDFSNLKGL